MDGTHASMETIEDGIARMILYNDDEDIRSFTWSCEDLPEDVRSGDQFEVSFNTDDDIESEVVGVSYSESMTEKIRDKLRIPTVESLVAGGAPESKVREYLANSGSSDAEIERIIDEYFDTQD